MIDWNFFCSRCDGSLHRRCGLVGGEFDSSLGMTTLLSPDHIPRFLRSLKQNILSAFPQNQITEGGQILASVHNGQKVIACKRSHPARERGGTVRDEYLRLADASRIPEDIAARGVTSMVFEFGQLPGIA